MQNVPELALASNRLDQVVNRRSFVIGSATSAAILVTRPALGQQTYPARPITLINPFPPGGAADLVGRPFAAMLEPLIKQPVVIETKAGAAGQVGAQFAAVRKARRLHAPHPHRIDFGLRRGRQVVRAAAEVHALRLHTDRALHGGADGC